MMLYQTDIYTEKTDTSRLYSDLSVKIHGFIMSRLPTDIAAAYHSGKVNPFSVYTVDAGDCFITRVSALSEEAKRITDIFRNVDFIRVFGAENNLRILKTEQSPPVAWERLPDLLPYNKYTLGFVTPAMFRRNGVWQAPPELPSYFLSVAAKLEHLENYIINKDEVFGAFGNIKYNAYSLQTVPFLSGSKTYTGMVGQMEITLPQKQKENDILRLLLAYATFSGVGGMTPQGMGGFIIERSNKKID